MASGKELAAGVRAVLARLAAARVALVGAAGPIEEAGRSYAQLGAGSAQPDLAVSAASLRTAYTQCRAIVAMLDQTANRLDNYLAAVAGPPVGPAALPAPPTGEPHPPRASDTVRAGDGSVYPAAVVGDLPDLPTRVRPGLPAARTVGVAYLNGHRVGMIVSGHRDPRTGQPDRYVAQARERLAECGLDQWNAHHVETKVVARMIESNIRQAEVNLNNVPCGYETTIVGCHQVLGDMLPFGSSLRVRGTYSDGTMAFDREYRGRGPA